MRLWINWALACLAWIISTLSMSVWPTLTELDLLLLGDMISALLYRPFHYLSGGFFLICFMGISVILWRRLIYELRVAYLFKRWPISWIAMGFFLIWAKVRVILFFGVPVLGIVLALFIYELNRFYRSWKDEVIILRK